MVCDFEACQEQSTGPQSARQGATLGMERCTTSLFELMVVRPPTSAKVFGIFLLGLIGVALTVAAFAALIQREGMLVGLILALAAMAFFAFAFGTSRVSLFADEHRIGSRSLLGTRQCSRHEIATIQIRSSSLYFRRTDGTTALTCSFYLFRASELRRFAAYLGLPLALPRWCR